MASYLDLSASDLYGGGPVFSYVLIKYCFQTDLLLPSAIRQYYRRMEEEVATVKDSCAAMLL